MHVESWVHPVLCVYVCVCSSLPMLLLLLLFRLRAEVFELTNYIARRNEIPFTVCTLNFLYVPSVFLFTHTHTHTVMYIWVCICALHDFLLCK